jgi:pimeloyl-ACP methyl ester carboxylesterase
MSALAVPGGELYFEDTGGDGPTVVLLHGGALDHRMWDPQAPVLAEHARVIRADARGHGRSSTPLAPFRQCDDVAALVQALDAAPAIVVGLSMGGAAAIDTALEHPDVVGALVVSGCGAGTPRFNDPWLLGIQAEWDRAQREADAVGWVEAFLKIAAGPRRSVDEVDPDVIGYCRAAAMATLMTHVRPGVAMPLPVATWERLGEIGVPVVAIAGELDAPGHVELTTRVAGGVRDGTLVTIPGTAHYPNLERAPEFNAAVRGILAR